MVDLIDDNEIISMIKNNFDGEVSVNSKIHAYSDIRVVDTSID
jgi:hypothetical protein